MLLVFMNSSKKVFESLRMAIIDAGFEIVQINIFDKQHATFKQLVSENTPGSDLIFHCRKPDCSGKLQIINKQNGQEFLHLDPFEALHSFLPTIKLEEFRVDFLHVDREPEFDYRKLYSFWLAQNLRKGHPIMDYPDFRDIVNQWLIDTGNSRYI
jgi:hypothetical protein